MNPLAKALAAILSACFAAGASANTGANVWCWAPGMQSAQLLNSYGMGTGHWLGHYDNYKIYGVAGVLTLGDQMSNASVDAADPQKRYRSGKKEWGNLGGFVTSYSAVKLRVDTEGRGFYPEKLEVWGDRLGATTGAVRLYGDTWEFQRPKWNQISMSIGFHLAAENENGEKWVNRNPSGYFYVVAECNATSARPTGKLHVTSDVLVRGSVTGVGYEIDRSGGGKGETPPFTGYNPGFETVMGGGN